MPHIYTYPQSVIDAVRLNGLKYQDVTVLMKCRAKYSTAQSANGKHTFSTEYKYLEVDITDRLAESEPLRIQTKKPEVPTGSGTGMRGANVRVVLINTDTYWSARQDGAILDPATITNATIEVKVKIGTVDITLYKGRVIGLPEERQGKTAFTIRDAVSDIVDKPIRWERIGDDQEMKIDEAGQPVISWEVVGTGNKHLRFFDAYTAFDEFGYPVSTLGSSKALLKNIDFTGAGINNNGLDLGQYRIKFTSTTGYTFTGPNFPVIYGSTTQDLDTTIVKIKASDWIITEDPTGEEISFQVCYTVSGNPVTLIRRLLEHGILGTWGNEPQQYPFLPIDYEKLDLLENRHQGVTVYVSETNDSNEVFLLGSQSRPLSVKNVVEKLCEHLGISMIVNEEGKISFTDIIRGGSDIIHPIDSSVIISHYLAGDKRRLNFIRAKYGESPVGGSGVAEVVFTEITVTDYDPASDYEPGDIVRFNSVYWQCVLPNPAGVFIYNNFVVFESQEHTVSFPYYPAASGLYMIQRLETLNYFERIFNSYDQVVAKILPEFGTTLMAGDMVELETTEQPEVTFEAAEVIRVSNMVGRECSVTLQRSTLPVISTGYDTGVWDEGQWE